MPRHIVIIGNGVAGVTTARNIRKQDSEAHVIIISGETKYFYSRTALMYVYMGHMRFQDIHPYEASFWTKNRIDLIQAWVKEIDFDKKELILAEGNPVNYDKLVLALGSTSNKFDWPGQDLPGVQSLYSYQDLMLLEENSKNCQSAVIVGGGLIGIEMAEMLHSRGIKVTMLVRESHFWGNVLPPQEASIIEKHIREHGIDLRLAEELQEVVAGKNGRPAKVKLKSGKEIACQIVGLTAGVHPNIDLVKHTKLETDNGILANEFLETNIPNVYAAGDCVQFKNPAKGRKAIEQVWYTGKIMGEALAKTICRERTKYEPGPWYNSAKFFDIEYQTYGWVPSVIDENTDEFYWEHSDAMHAMHFVFTKQDKKLIGVNTFGIRLRHQLFDKWLGEEKNIEYVLAHLPDANFDPELYKKYEKDIVAAYNRKYGTRLMSKKKSWKNILKAASI